MKATTRPRTGTTELADRVAQLQKAGNAPDALAAAQAAETKAQGLTDAAVRPRAWADEPRPHPPADRRGPIRHASASALVETFAGMCQETNAALARWNDLGAKDVPQLNGMLAGQRLAPLTAPKEALALGDCGK